MPVTFLMLGHTSLILHSRYMEETGEIQISRSQSSTASAGQTCPIHGGCTSEFTELIGFAAHVLVPDTTDHLQGSSGVHALIGQSCFG